jgi:uncharacterized protein (TIGR02246 family)
MRILTGFALLMAVAWSTSAVVAEDVIENSAEDTTAIRQSISSYEAAFNARDAATLAAHWSPEGVYTSRLSGNRIVGRDALLKEFTELFAEVKDAILKLSTESIAFVSPNVAVEHGAATVIRSDAEPTTSGYSVVYVRRDGKWLIDRVSDEEDTQSVSSHYEQLRELEWMTGSWIDHDGGSTIRTECKWTRNQNFLTRSFTASVEDQIDITGMQIVGWDAAREQFRSWTFDSEGGVAEGTWKHSGDHWIIKTTATLSDGRKGSSTTILRPLDSNSFGWQKTNRIVAGEIMPNIDEVVIVREKAE